LCSSVNGIEDWNKDTALRNFGQHGMNEEEDKEALWETWKNLSVR
jgi:hypothetical protein